MAPGDEIATVDTTSGCLSAGVSYATTAYAGTGNATLTVYSNKATLKLFGEGGNNTFIVQAFQIVNTSSVATSNTQINTGNGNNLVEYNINAPVAIDGGSGYNTLVVIGTQGDDTFVITKDGVIGAGLNVSYTNIAKIEVDGLGGNDTFDVLSTEPDVVTVLEGGIRQRHVQRRRRRHHAGRRAQRQRHERLHQPRRVEQRPRVQRHLRPRHLGQRRQSDRRPGDRQPERRRHHRRPRTGPARPTSRRYTMALGIAPPTPTTVWYMSVAAAPDPTADGGSSVQLSDRRDQLVLGAGPHVRRVGGRRQRHRLEPHADDLRPRHVDDGARAAIRRSRS